MSRVDSLSCCLALQQAGSPATLSCAERLSPLQSSRPACQTGAVESQHRLVSFLTEMKCVLIS